MQVELILPDTLAGFRIGSSIDEYDLSAFVFDGVGYGTTDLISYKPEVGLTICDTIVVSIVSRGVCWFLGRNIVGMAVAEAIDFSGLVLLSEDTQGPVAGFFELSHGIQFTAFDGIVSIVTMSDFDLIPE